VNDDSFQISDLAEIVEVDWFGSDLEFMQRWSRHRSYAALRGATRERERRGVAHEGERRALPRSSLNPHMSNSPLRGPLYRGIGGSLPPHQATPRVGGQGREGAALGLPNPNPSSSHAHGPLRAHLGGLAGHPSGLPS
jgi:hypothetical protein